MDVFVKVIGLTMNSIALFRSAGSAAQRHIIVAFSMLLTTASLPAWAQQVGLPDVSCAIMPSLTVDVASSVPGVLSSVSVDRSHLVKRGQVIAQLDSGVEQAELALANARAKIYSEVKLNEVNLNYDERTRDRFNSLQQGEMASKQERDRAERNASLSKWRLKQAKDINELRTLELTRSQEVLKRKSIASPIDGVVTKRFRTAGEYVKEQPIIRVVQLDPLHVEAAVPMQYFGKINKGMRARVSLHSNPANSYVSQIELVDSVGDITSSTFGVRLQLSNSELTIAAGSKCNLSFIVE